MTTIGNDARAALRERLGSGARYDSPAAPASDLALARLGTAYFARQLNEISDEGLDRPSLVAGWSRRHVVAHVGFQARALARLVAAARKGRDRETIDEPEAQNEDVALSATLPSHALRYLFKHSEVHLNVEWRDLEEPNWGRRVSSLQGEVVTIRETAWRRAREIWLRAVDLDNGATFYDFPRDLTARLLKETAEKINGQSKGISVALKPTDNYEAVVIGTGKQQVKGRASDLLRWLAGRGSRRLDPSMPDFLL
jgi:maleylpyruvate isomerase